MKKLILPLLAVIILSACSQKNADSMPAPDVSIPLKYAEQFTAGLYGNDALLVTVGGNDTYLFLRPDSTFPESLEPYRNTLTVIEYPTEHIYCAATSAVDLFDGADALDHLLATSTSEHDWSLPVIKSAMSDEDILYAGKYSAPDFELLLSEGCDLAVESTMIYHKPEIKEQLEQLGIPVFVERSSYESHPLGRLEWIKLYGLITGKYEEAESFFEDKCRLLENTLTGDRTGKTAAFFYINTSGAVVIKKPNDYVPKMMEMAGGEYIFTCDDLNVDDTALSNMDLQFETFYAKAKNADILIYNSTIDGGISSTDDLIAKNSLFADFRAVKSGNVWCTEKNLFQQTTGAAEMICELNGIFTESEGSANYFFRLE